MKMFAFYVVAGAALLAQEQHSPAVRPAFEVVSIKLCQGRGADRSASPGRLYLECRSLSDLIKLAYDTFASGMIDPSNLGDPVIPLEGQPAWVDSDRYTIDAKAVGRATQAMMRGPMMQAALEERFHLRIHRATRTVPVFALTVPPGGSKLRPTPEGSCAVVVDSDMVARESNRDGKPLCGLVLTSSTADGGMIFDVHGMRLDAFCRYIRGLARPVINGTGLTGLFDIHLELHRGEPVEDGSPTPPPTMADIVNRQLGLRLEPASGPRDYLVIDHIERLSDN